MIVTIGGREVEYISDYPDGWKFSAGDPFKFPVLIGDSPCFVKRFEQKTPEDISGWDLLVKISGKYEKNLSRIYDIKNVKEAEDDKEIYYIFYEYLDGTTLDRYIQDSDINLIHLNNDLFNALRALQKYEFWFADFCEKNIFCQKDGSFVLVDVDSTQRVADLPVNDMYGSKDYWILVLKFYKEVLNKNDIRLSDINGITLNYLQIPFLVLRLKMFLTGGKKDYNSTAPFNKLPSQLHKMVPEFRDIYLNVLENSKDPLSEETISKIEDLVEKRIVKAQAIPDVDVAPVSLPAIKAFSTSNNEIESGGSFTLSWQVENANKLELFKNGARFKELDATETSIALTGFADGTRQQSSYQLYAYKDLAMAKSDPIVIKLKGDPAPPPPPPPGPNGKPAIGKKVMIGVGLLVIILGIVFFLTRKKGPVDTDGNTGKTDSTTIVDSIAKTDTPAVQKVDTTTFNPVADAGPSQSITFPKNDILLNGIGTVAKGSTPKYHWILKSGPSAPEIGEPNSSSTLVKGLVEGTYTFRLEVTDNKGLVGADEVQVNVNPGVGNILPTADAGQDQSIVGKGKPANAIATLKGSGTDVDARGRPLKYTWRQFGQTAGFGFDATIDNPIGASTTVRGLNYGTYTFQLTVTDPDGGIAQNIVRVTVSNLMIFVPITRMPVLKQQAIDPGVFKVKPGAVQQLQLNRGRKDSAK